MKYDWEKIEQEFISGKSTMEAMARKYQIPLNTFYKRANVRKFSEKRENYAKRVQEKALARAQARDARTLGNLSSALDKAARLLNKYIVDEDTLFGRVIETKEGVQEYRVKKMDTKVVRDLTAAVKDAAAAMRLLTPEKESEEEDNTGIIELPEVDDE